MIRRHFEVHKNDFLKEILSKESGITIIETMSMIQGFCLRYSLTQEARNGLGEMVKI